MKLLFKSLIILLLIPAITVANNGNWKYTKEKTINKEFTVNADALLTVDNAYGNLDIVTWNENRIVIQVLIKASGNDEEEVIERLEKVDVDFSASASNVSAKTNFGNKKNNSWSLWGKKKSVSLQVHYTIKMPVTNSVNLSNDYGNINLNRLEGNAKISCDYGQLILGDLMAEDNMLTFDYTSNSTIAYMKSGKINADYSGFILDKADRLELMADYTKSEVGEVNDLNYRCDYGKITVGKAGKIVGRGDYIPNKLGTITESLNLNTDYGSISVENLASTINDVTIRSDYTGIKIGYDSSASFDFALRLTYAGLGGEDGLTITRSDKDHTSKYYEGYNGTQNSGATISINSSYGGVTFRRN